MRITRKRNGPRAPIEHVILDFFEGEKKVAEIPAADLANRSRKEWNDFWRAQDLLGRTYKFRRIFIALMLVILLGSCAHQPWSKTDKLLFAGVVAAQVADGISTQRMLEANPNNYISSPWDLKYGTRRPDPETLWTVKATELLIAYIVGSLLPPDVRKAFFIGTGGLLTFYAITNPR